MEQAPAHLLVSSAGDALLASADGTFLDWTASSSAGGSYGSKKVVIRKGKRLLAFRNHAEAIAALEHGQTIEASGEVAEGFVEPPEPIQTVEVREVRRLAQRFDRADEYQRLLDTAQYTELVLLFDALKAWQQDEEDVEILLLA